MPTYRYKNKGVSLMLLQQAVPGTPTISGTAPDMYSDITVDSQYKPDLDDYMASRGFDYDSQDPANVAVVKPLHGSAVDADGLGHLHVIRKSFAATGAGADDVTVYSANAPFAFRVVDCHLLIDTAVALTTATLRDATGGGGSALSSALDTGGTGVSRNDGQVTGTVAANGSLVLRRSNGNTVGELIVAIQRI